jgi:hypothetical protein
MGAPARPYRVVVLSAEWKNGICGCELKLRDTGFAPAALAA